MAISLAAWKAMDPETNKIIDGDGYEWIIREKVGGQDNPTFVMESYGVEPERFSYDIKRDVIVDSAGIEVRELNDKDAKVIF